MNQTTLKPDLESDKLVLSSLKARFFQLALKEDYSKTPDITKELDALVREIRIRKAIP